MIQGFLKHYRHRGNCLRMGYNMSRLVFLFACFLVFFVLFFCTDEVSFKENNTTGYHGSKEMFTIKLGTAKNGAWRN